MTEKILLGRGDQILEVPRTDWEAHFAGAPHDYRERLSFMTDDHRRARTFVVRELFRTGVPIPPERVARELGLEVERAVSILEELERRLFFLVRNEAGEVSWAFPVTVEETPHELSFSTGERLYGA